MAKLNQKFKPLSRQVIVITGASSGIGLATARLAAKKGARVVIASRNYDELERIARELGPTVLAVGCDVKNFGELESLRAQAEAKFGRIDTWINNAGTSIYGRLVDLDEKEERELFDVNFWGVRHGSRVAVDALRAQGGVLINVGSEVSQSPVPLQGVYSATKHAVKAYTDALRMELEKDGHPIAVCLIRPTAIDTPFPQHAANRLRDGEPSLPSPAYPPETVAKAILDCAVKPRRDVFVGGPSRFGALLDLLTPRVADYVRRDLLMEKQILGGKEPRRPSEEALFRAPRKEGEARGDHKGHKAMGSLYTRAALHPLGALFTVAALAAGSYLLARFVAGGHESTTEAGRPAA